MNLKTIKNDWEALADRDALWSILTDSSRANGRWDPAEFMATGESEIQTVMDHLTAIGHVPEFEGVALDFGCGVGRLTQALGRRFSYCVGVDISQQMIDKAERYNQHPHCHYTAHEGTVLPFVDESFSFIYSNIVLQHIPAVFAKQYLSEFVRVLAFGGVLVFGVQDSFAAPDIASRLTRVRHRLRLRSRVQKILGFRQHYMQMHCLPETVVRQSIRNSLVVDVQFTNTAAKDYNGRLVYLRHAPVAGYVGKQYSVLK
jgi:ubiquinone/menaquinone biosynthesis C-methylase UbiE